MLYFFVFTCSNCYVCNIYLCFEYYRSSSAFTQYSVCNRVCHVSNFIRSFTAVLFSEFNKTDYCQRDQSSDIIIFNVFILNLFET